MLKEKADNKLRYNILIAVVYIIGIVLLLQLFNLQIVHGQEYREKSNTRLTRETVIKAARGNVLDSSGEKLVSTKLVYNVEIYKTKIDTQVLNDTLLLLAQTLESNGDKYTDNFPKFLQKDIKNSIIQKHGKMCKYKKKVAWKNYGNIQENIW